MQIPGIYSASKCLAPSFTVLGGIFYQLKKAHGNRSVRAIILTGANGKFSAGFDVTLFKESPGGGIISGDDSQGGWVNESFCDLLESGVKPTVAAINGLALGGGCEALMSCNARICTPKSVIGLPELKLGIIPGFGGTQRLPRLVGLQEGLSMMLQSKQMSGLEAGKLGLVDEVVPPVDLMKAARAMALKLAEGKIPRMMTLYRTDRIPPLGQALIVLDAARGMARKAARGLEHPQLCIDAVEFGIQQGGMSGLSKV